MCAITEKCPMAHAIRELNGQIADFLREVTLDTLMKTKHDKLPRLGRPVSVGLQVRR